MPILFWLCLIGETRALIYFIQHAIVLYSGKSGYADSELPGLYVKVLLPAVFLVIILSSALIARFRYDKGNPATWIVLIPVLIVLFIMLFMFASGKATREWRWTRIV